MIDFLEDNDILYHKQFGFRKRHRTTHAIIALTEKVSMALDSGKIIGGVFLDLKKAFDCVSYDTLLNKLYAYGIRGSLRQWFQPRLSKHGGLVTYIHNTFSFERLSDNMYNQNLTVYESMFLKIYKKSSKFTKYIIGNIYCRPSSTLDELAQFIDEFTTVTQNLQEQHIKSYLCGDYNINLLKIDSLLHYNRFFENITTLGFFP